MKPDRRVAVDDAPESTTSLEAALIAKADSRSGRRVPGSPAALPSASRLAGVVGGRHRVRFLRQRPDVVGVLTPEARLAVEVDGRSHDRQGHADAVRIRALLASLRPSPEGRAP